jgi:hypothetical protein
MHVCVQKRLLLKCLSRILPCKARDHTKPRDFETVNAETPQARQLAAIFLSVLRYPNDAHREGYRAAAA